MMNYIDSAMQTFLADFDCNEKEKQEASICAAPFLKKCNAGNSSIWIREATATNGSNGMRKEAKSEIWS